MTIGDVIKLTGGMLADYNNMHKLLNDVWGNMSCARALEEKPECEQQRIQFLHLAFRALENAMELNDGLAKDTGNIQYGLMYEFEDYGDIETEENDG